MDAVALSLQLVQTADKIWTFLKNVKNAPEDLQRISDTVESLRTISKNVHTVLISQQPQVVQDQQDPVPAPRPLPGIEACLRKCEEQLRPLEDIVNKHSAAFRNDSPKLDKLWSSIRMGFKSKDIADFHTRVHREMDFLKLWLELNSYHYKDIRSMQESFLMAIKTTMTQVVPVNQGTCPAPNVGPASSSDTYSYSQDIDLYAPSHRTTVDVAPHRRSTQLLVKVHSIDMPLIIRCLGLRGKKVRKYLQFEQRDEENINSERPVIISEEVVYSWEFHNLRRGVELHFDSLHSAILPAVSSYPVMQGSMLRLCRDIFATGTLKDLQTAFSSGKLHPFTRNVDGYTLLHRLVIVEQTSVSF
ncbi:uncharacterized protein EI97DRAFT_243141 [Westerdykella ornata]|uniref:NACHT-NTPase and P-loop NTPases N-terminal domain-containing protein n=1 Tax=Westerdykella ornata TaxID=318751 RepID=A0A6A6J6F3_WESOR|nr:uncharacterized protein EI97DRAFT_243141 [Westerdykella ornata]KAF2271794.1 hypothetical protein EI97DRAFT_243141 [Westerdykella ornata]